MRIASVLVPRRVVSSPVPMKPGEALIVPGCEAGIEKPPLHFSRGGEGVGRSGGSYRYDVVSERGIAPYRD